MVLLIINLILVAGVILKSIHDNLHAVYCHTWFWCACIHVLVAQHAWCMAIVDSRWCMADDFAWLLNVTVSWLLCIHVQPAHCESCFLASELNYQLTLVYTESHVLVSRPSVTGHDCM